MPWRASTAPTATCRRAARDPIRPKSRYKEIPIWRAIFLVWILSKRRRFSDILIKTLPPTRRGPGSYQYRVNLERRGRAVKPPRGFFWTLGHGGLRSVDLLQTPDADRIAQARGHTFCGGAGAAHRGDARHAIRHGAASDRLLIGERARA